MQKLDGPVKRLSDGNSAWPIRKGGDTKRGDKPSIELKNFSCSYGWGSLKAKSEGKNELRLSSGKGVSSNWTTKWKKNSYRGGRGGKAGISPIKDDEEKKQTCKATTPEANSIKKKKKPQSRTKRE